MKIIERDFLISYNAGSTDLMISKQFNVDQSTAYSFRIRRKLPKNPKKTIWNDVNISLLKQFLIEGKSKIEIGKLIGASSRQVECQQYKLGLKSNYTNSNKLLELTLDQKAILTGMCLGDASIKKDYVNASVSWAHSLKQELYCLHKKELFKGYITAPAHYKSTEDPRTLKTYHRVDVYTKSNPCFNEFRAQFYPNKKRGLLSTSLKYFNALSLMYWYYDDGHKTSSSYSIATCAYSKEEVKLLQDKLFQLWGFETTHTKGGSIYLHAKYKNAFKKLLLPITKDILYKI